MMNTNLAGKVVIVTGATSGIGKAIAEAYIAEKAIVYVTGLTEDDCVKTVNELGGSSENIIPFKLDITNKDDIAHIIDHAKAMYHKIDVIVNNAGMVGRKPTFEIDEPFFDKMYEVNVKGTFFFTQAVAKVMVEQQSGKIINISSASGKLIRKGLANPVYSMNKAAINLMTMTIAEDLAKHHINVNAIAPGYIVTGPVLERFKKDSFYQGVVDSTPIPRIGEVSDIQGMAVFLGSQLADYITGQIIYVDGGRTVL